MGPEVGRWWIDNPNTLKDTNKSREIQRVFFAVVIVLYQKPAIFDLMVYFYNT